MKNLPALNLPSFDCKIKESDGKYLIFDVVRKKFVLLQPEEWVRQHIIHLLISHLQYPKGLLKIESGMHYNALQKRTDILVYDQRGLPYLLVECKAPEQAIDQKSIRQAAMYNQSLRAPYMALSNGLKTYCLELSFEAQSSIQMAGFPPAPSL